jgi:hypothetical protein
MDTYSMARMDAGTLDARFAPTGTGRRGTGSGLRRGSDGGASAVVIPKRDAHLPVIGRRVGYGGGDAVEHPYLQSSRRRPCHRATSAFELDVGVIVPERDRGHCGQELIS